MGMSVEHGVDATGGSHQSVGVDARVIGGLAQVRQYHHVVGTLLTGLVYGRLHELVDMVRAQVVELVAVVVEERVALAAHGLWRSGADEGDALVTVTLDDIAREHGRD